MSEKPSILKNQHIDYKDIDLLGNFINPHGKIRPRKHTGASVKTQRKLAQAIKQARFIGLLPFSIK